MSEFLGGKSERKENTLHAGDLVNNFSNMLRLWQSPWEDWLKHVAKNDKGEGNEFWDRVYPKSQEGAVGKGINLLPAYAKM